MRLLQSVLPTLPQTKKPQRKFIVHLLGLLLMLPGHATFRNLSRYSAYHERITSVPSRGGTTDTLTLSHSTRRRLPR